MKMYEHFWKRMLDILLSAIGLLFFMAVCFDCNNHCDRRFWMCHIQTKKSWNTQNFFYIHKFRTMNTDAPMDIPTHLMGNSSQYTTRVGRFLRTSSLDELPQLWDIFRGKMSVVGPRPALWNQDDLIAERDKYHANDVKPGLTGWAQINGRDELEIPIKARLDGTYAEKLKKGGWGAFIFDCKCFFRTFHKVISKEGIQ